MLQSSPPPFVRRPPIASTLPMQQPWSPSSWQTKPLSQRVAYADADALHAVLTQLSRLPPLVTSGEVETLKQYLAEAARGERFLLLRRRLCREFRRLPLGRDRRQAEDSAEDEHHPHARLESPRGPRGAIGRAIRQAAFGRHGEPQRPDAAQLPRRPDQPPRIHARGSCAAARVAPARLRARGADAELHPRADPRRFHRLPPPRVLGSGFRQLLGRVEPVPRHDGRRGPRRPLPGDGGRTFAGRGHRPQRVLRQPRGTTPRLRTGADPAGAAAQRLVQPVHAFPLDRRPHALARRRATSSTFAASPTRWA